MINEQTYQKLLAEKEAEILFLRTELANIKKLIFGSKRERHLSLPNEQGNLFATAPEAVDPPKEEPQNKKEKRELSRPKKKRISTSKPQGFPAHLKRVEQRLEVKDLPEDAKEIGVDTTELLAYQEGYFYVLELVRPRLASKKEDKIYQANIPPRLVPKGKLDESIIA